MGSEKEKQSWMGMNTMTNDSAHSPSALQRTSARTQAHHFFDFYGAHHPPRSLDNNKNWRFITIPPFRMLARNVTSLANLAKHENLTYTK